MHMLCIASTRERQKNIVHRSTMRTPRVRSAYSQGHARARMTSNRPGSYPIAHALKSACFILCNEREEHPFQLVAFSLMRCAREMLPWQASCYGRAWHPGCSGHHPPANTTWMESRLMHDTDNGETGDSAWLLVFEGFDPADEGRREALCALGNGKYVSRAAAPWAIAGETHYPGTYRAGCYNRLASEVNGELVTDESAVNLPSWLPHLPHRRRALVRPGRGDPAGLPPDPRPSPWPAPARAPLPRQRRPAHNASRNAPGEHEPAAPRRPAAGAHRRGLGGELELRSATDGRVVNDNVQRYRTYRKRHLQIVHCGAVEPEGIAFEARTTQSGITVAVAARTTVAGGTGERRELAEEPEQIAELFATRIARGATVVVEKVAAYYTSRDRAVDDSGSTVNEYLGRLHHVVSQRW